MSLFTRYAGTIREVFCLPPAEYGPRTRMRRFIVFSLFLVLSSATTFIVTAFFLKVRETTGRAPRVSAPTSRTGKDVELSAHVVSVDPASRTIVMDWYPRLAPSLVRSCSDYLEQPIIREFYIPLDLFDISSPAWSLDRSSPLPLYTLNRTAQCLALATSSFTSFRTITKLLSSAQAVAGSGGRFSSLQNYPFDQYVAPLSISVKDPTTGEVGSPVISQFLGIVVNFEISLGDSAAKSTPLGYDELIANLLIKRSKAVQAFVVATAITNWLAATAFLVIVAATIFYPHHQIYSEMFVVPAGVLFAFTSVRANLPGAPDGFGTTLDMFSILPVLIIMSFCSFSLLLIVLYRRISQITASHFWPTTTETRADRHTCDCSENRNDPEIPSKLTPRQVSTPSSHGRQSIDGFKADEVCSS